MAQARWKEEQFKLKNSPCAVELFYFFKVDTFLMIHNIIKKNHSISLQNSLQNL